MRKSIPLSHSPPTSQDPWQDKEKNRKEDGRENTLDNALGNIGYWRDEMMPSSQSIMSRMCQ